MSDPIAIRARPTIAGPLRGAAPVAADVLNASQAVGEAPVPATVIERAKDGTLLLRTPQGMVSLRAAQALPPGTRVELRLAPGGGVALVVIEPEAEAEPSSDARQRAALPIPLPDDPASAAPAEIAPARSNGWPALDQALGALEKSAPKLAAQLRAELLPQSGGALAGTLLFALGTLYSGRWPGTAIARALGMAPESSLRARLEDDIAGLARLAGDAATGEWQVVTLPLILGDAVQPLRLYLRRRDARPQAKDEARRFVLEAELSRLGPMQLDGMVHGSRIALVVRSHARFPDELRGEAGQIFHAACAAQGLAGELVFATVAEFAVAPMAPLIRHVALSI